MSNKMLFQQFFIVACNQSKSFHIMFAPQSYYKKVKCGKK